MKKLIPLLIILTVMGIIAVIFISMAKDKQPVTIVKGNTEMKALPLKVNFTNDLCPLRFSTMVSLYENEVGLYFKYSSFSLFIPPPFILGMGAQLSAHFL